MNLYVAECLTYGGKHPVKVGISKNPYKRMRQLGSMGVRCAALRAIFVFADKKKAASVERECCRRFKRSWADMMISREILDVSVPEICEFVRKFKPQYSIILETLRG